MVEVRWWNGWMRGSTENQKETDHSATGLVSEYEENKKEAKNSHRSEYM